MGEHSSFFKYFTQTALFLLLGFCVSFLCHAQEPAVVYKLPFPDGDARYFYYDNNFLHIGNYPDRAMYKITSSNECEKILDVAGWAANDAAMFQGKIVFCSRDRILYKEQDKVKTVSIAGARDLSSITASGKNLFLLDKNDEGKPSQILILDRNLSVKKKLDCPLRNPLDLYWHEENLWIYDQADKCVYRLDILTQKLTARILAPVGNSWSRGIVFIEDQLYVHDRPTASLVPIMWKQEGRAFYSSFEETFFTFVNASKNNSSTETTKAEFRVPFPANTPDIAVSSLQWNRKPDEIIDDRFGQKLASFRNISILPGDEHILSYNATIQHSAVQYLLDEVALDSLDKIPGEIKELYLGNDTYIQTMDPVLVDYAKKARVDSLGREPAGVKSLIENLVHYITDRLSYIDDDKWESAAVVIANQTGSCSEYSFLFSTLARINNIPTRLAGGVQTNGAFHRWTEVYYPGTGWVPVDVTKIDSSTRESYDYEYLFGKSGHEIILSRIGSPDDSLLGANYFIYRNYSGGKRERTTKVEIKSTRPVSPVKERIIHVPGG
ncbi:MAG: transglutaminase domain-containing protein [Spirochaetales bacterium]|nr:transglutaminase domain-containing protein [Spirochaetales bacterium]